MATYKVIQDVEAEDKLVGPLTLRQFIYALIAAACLYLTYLVSSKGVIVLAPVFLLPAVVAGFFAFPWGRDQSTEIWALARIRFLFFPRKRIWNQSGVKDLVTVTAPKRPEQIYTDGLSQTEVRSRLKALATTIDSRGWALKDSVLVGAAPTASDRLVATDTAPRQVPTIGAEAYEDVLDEHEGVGQKFESLLSANAQAARSKLAATLDSATPVAAQQPASAGTPADYWFLNQAAPPQQADPGTAVFRDSTVHPGQDVQDVVEDAQEQALEAIIANPNHTSGNLQSEVPHINSIPTIQPLSAGAQQPAATSPPPVQPAVVINDPPPQPVVNLPQQPVAVSAPVPEPPVTAEPSADILSLSQNNDLSIATLSREASKSDDNEVTISLH